MRTTPPTESTTCQLCLGRRWTPKGLCRACHGHGPVLPESCSQADHDAMIAAGPEAFLAGTHLHHVFAPDAETNLLGGNCVRCESTRYLDLTEYPEFAAALEIARAA